MILLRNAGALIFEQVDFNHPMWVVYSSGTTGLPKPLVHSQGGILIEFLKFTGIARRCKAKRFLFLV